MGDKELRKTFSKQHLDKRTPINILVTWSMYKQYKHKQLPCCHYQSLCQNPEDILRCQTTEITSIITDPVSVIHYPVWKALLWWFGSCAIILLLFLIMPALLLWFITTWTAHWYDRLYAPVKDAVTLLWRTANWPDKFHLRQDYPRPYMKKLQNKKWGLIFLLYLSCLCTKFLQHVAPQ